MSMYICTKVLPSRVLILLKLPQDGGFLAISLVFTTTCVCVCVCVYTHAQSHPILCSHMDCNLHGSSVHGIFQAKILEWVAIPYSWVRKTQGLNLHLLCLLHWQADSLPLAPPKKLPPFSLSRPRPCSVQGK